MKQKYPAMCYGYHDPDRGILVVPHEVFTDHYVMPGSSMLCPDCAKFFFEDIERLGKSNLEEKAKS